MFCSELSLLLKKVIMYDHVTFKVNASHIMEEGEGFGVLRGKIAAIKFDIRFLSL